MASKNPSKQPAGLKNVDFLGSKFSLGFPSSTGTFQTNLGGSVTILMGIVSITTFVIIMSQYFDKSGPIVTTSSEFESKVMQFNIYRQKLFSPIGMYVGTKYVQSGWDRYVTVKARVDKAFYNNATHEFVITPHLEFDFVPCDTINDEIVLGYIKEISPLEGFEKIFICPDFRGMPDEYTLLDDMESWNYKWISVHVYPCSKENPDECAPEAEIKALTVDIAPVSKLIEPSNFENPVKNFMVRRNVEVEPQLKKILKFDLKNHRVMDDASRFSPPVIRQNFSSSSMTSSDYRMRDKNQLHCSKAVISRGPHGGCIPYITYAYYGIGDIGVIRRNYKKWTEMLGEFGGILKVITTSMFFIYTFYNLWKMKYYIGRMILGSDEKRAQEAKDLLHLKNNPEKHKSNKLIAKGQGVDEKVDQEVMKKILESRLNVNDLLSKLNTVDLLEQVLFDGDEKQKSLIPLVLFKALKKKVKKVKVDAERDFHQQEAQHGYLEKKKLSNKKDMLNEKETQSQGSSFREGYESLLSEEKEEKSLRSVIRRYMLDHLQDVFTETSEQNIQKEGLSLANSEVIKLNRDKPELDFGQKNYQEAQPKGAIFKGFINPENFDDSISAISRPTISVESSRLKKRLIRGPMKKIGPKKCL